MKRMLPVFVTICTFCSALLAKPIKKRLWLESAPQLVLQPYHPTQLTMTEAVAQAIKHRPDLEALAYATHASRSAAKSAIAGYFPTFTLDSSLWLWKGMSAPRDTTFLTADQLIYSFAGPLQQYRKAKKYAELSELDETIQNNKIQLEVEKAFIQTWLIQEQKRTINALTKSSKETFKQAEHQRKLDLLDKNVWLKSAEDYGFALSDINQYQDTLFNTYTRLEFLMGQPLYLLELNDPDKPSHKPTKLIWQYKKNHELKPLDEYYDLAIHNRPEIKQGPKRIAIERQNIKLAQGDRLPTIAFKAQAGYEGLIDPKRFHAWQELRLSASWTLFDGLVSQYQEQQAYANRIKEILNLDQTVLNIKQEVQDKYYSYSRSLIKLKAQKLNYLRNHNEFKLRKQEFEIGQISPVEFEAAKTTWEQAKFNWLSVNAEVASYERDLMYSCGYPRELE